MIDEREKREVKREPDLPSMVHSLHAYNSQAELGQSQENAILWVSSTVFPGSRKLSWKQGSWDWIFPVGMLEAGQLGLDLLYWDASVMSSILSTGPTMLALRVF